MTTDDEGFGPEIWRQISFLFSEALELPGPDRNQFLSRACEGNQTLESEVRKLLANHESATEFLEEPALPPTSSEPDIPVFQSGDLLADRFQLDCLLGAGGMGEVYRAFDSELGQMVAIKTLRRQLARDEEMTRQFRVEVLHSRQITHRNVVRVHDLFTHTTPDGLQTSFFTMELIEGETLAQHIALRGAFKPSEARGLLGQMAAALDAAHLGGVVHRDLKPGNVFLTTDAGGAIHVKITDFGIAADFARRSERPVVTGENLAGSMPAGTPTYMAPEQMNGEPTTPATDIFALALIAYEMLTGNRVYDTDSPLVCLLRKSAPGDPEPCAGDRRIPPRWASAIHRALRRDPAERPASVGEFVAAIDNRVRRRLWIALVTVAAVASAAAALGPHLGPGIAPKPTSIAVLPFVSDNDQVYLADGVAEGLARALGMYPNVRVAPVAAAAAYQKRNVSPAEIAKSLNVDLLVTGSVQQSGHKVHVLAHLENGRDGKEFWQHPYDCDAEQILSVQQDITQNIARRLSLSKPSPKDARPPTNNQSAYVLYMRGRYFGNMRSQEKLIKSLDYFNQAIGQDKNFALAYTEVAESYEMLFEYGWLTPLEARPKMLEALNHALALDPDDAKTLACRGLFNHRMAWNQIEAERDFLRALSRDPNLAEAHHWYAAFLWREGRFDEALREAEDARRLDPVTLPTLLALGWVRYARHEYTAAIEICKQALELNPAYSSAFQLMAQAHADLGQTEQALAASRETLRLDTDHAVALRHRALVLSRLPGYREEARQLAVELEGLSKDRQAGYLARIYGALRDREQMYRWADRAIALHDIGLLEFKVDPALDWARSEASFKDIVRKTGL